MKAKVAIDGKLVCSVCRLPKLLAEFKPDKRTPNGVDSHCRQCGKMKSRTYRKNNLEQERTRGRNWQRAHTAQTRARRYGVSPEKLATMMQEQKGLCPGCLRNLERLGTKKGWHVDHDHSTGTVRGLLCAHCNLSVGQARDNATVLRRLAQYLDSHVGLSLVLDYLRESWHS